MKHIHVTCAIIEHDNLVLAAQRSASMKLPYKWEFPGGKIRANEEPRACLQREIQEELEMEIEITGELAPVTHQYPDFAVTLYPFVCRTDSNQLKLHEHAGILWLKPQDLKSLNWAEADVPVVDAYLCLLRSENL